VLYLRRDTCFQPAKQRPEEFFGNCLLANKGTRELSAPNIRPYDIIG
jgi:hypothetical protein